jgi:hypothetical protein
LSSGGIAGVSGLVWSLLGKTDAEESDEVVVSGLEKNKIRSK